MAKKPKPLFIIYSDIHHHIWSSFNENLRRTKIALKIEQFLFKKAEELNCRIIFAGDLIHNESHLTNDLFTILIKHFRKLEKYKTMWYGISGNHDQSSISVINKKPSNYIKNISYLNKNMQYIDYKTLYIEDIGFKLYGIPYLTNDNGLHDYIDNLELDKKLKNILIIHTTLPSCLDTNGKTIQTHSLGNNFLELVSNKFDLTITGHIHKPMLIKNNILQVGCPNQQRKTDKDCNMGYWVLYDDMSLKFFDTKAPRFIEVDNMKGIIGSKEEFKNYYYNKPKEVVQNSDESILRDKFKNPNNIKGLVRSYLKEKSIKDKDKKVELLRVLKKAIEDDNF
jgi:DNA repair exonuclease SbcCD nuclease subunit